MRVAIKSDVIDCTGCKSNKRPKEMVSNSRFFCAFSPRQVETVISVVSWLLYGIWSLCFFLDVSLNSWIFHYTNQKITKGVILLTLEYIKLPNFHNPSLKIEKVMAIWTCELETIQVLKKLHQLTATAAQGATGLRMINGLCHIVRMIHKHLQIL